MRKKILNSKKRTKISALVLSMTLLTGCAGQELPSVIQSEATDGVLAESNSLNATNNQLQDDIQNTENTGSHSESGKSEHTENEAGTVISENEKQRSCIIQEDDNYLYLCGSYRVLAIKKRTGEGTVLWENAQLAERMKERLYSDGSGLLLGDKLYFVERWFDEDDEEYRALSMVHTDGSGYERIIELDRYSEDSMLLWNNMLYLDGKDKEIWFQVDETGNLSNQDTLIAKNINQITYQKNGNTILFAKENITPPDAGDLVAFNDKYFLVRNYEEGGVLILVDRETLEERVLLTLENDLGVITMDNYHVYTVSRVYELDTIKSTYEKINLDTGNRTTIFTQENSGFGKDVCFLMDIVVSQKDFYYLEEENGKYYLTHRNLNQPDIVEYVGEALYDNAVSEIGTVLSDYKEFYGKDNQEKPLSIMSLVWLQVDEKYPGGAAVNAYMTDYLNQKESHVKASLEEMEAWMIPEDMGVANEYSSTFTGLGYYDSRYISYYQQEYEYMSGAAHGMPYWNGFTFDLQTGERLLLSDIMSNSEAELKEIVTSYFAEKFNRNPEDYWADAADSVREWTTYESGFYLTKEGIVFYYEPYALACYAAGFQTVTIPYEEFDMTISLEKW